MKQNAITPLKPVINLVSAARPTSQNFSQIISGMHRAGWVIGELGYWKTG